MKNWFFCLLLFPLIVISQEKDVETNHKEHDHDLFHNNEIGISMAPVYFIKEKVTNFGLHGHYVKRLGNSRFGVGVGVEYIFNEEQHQTYSATLQYSPLNQLHLIVAPGIAIEKEIHDPTVLPTEEEDHGIVFALHLEGSYEFHLKHFDIGPSFEFAYDPHDIHLSLGVHFAIPF